MTTFDARVYEKTERVRAWVNRRPVSLCWATAVVAVVWAVTVLACR